MPSPSELTKTLDAAALSLSPAAKQAATLHANPRSTIEPPQRPSKDPTAWAQQLLHDLTEGRAESLVVHDTLGEGGMGVVLRATQQSMGRDVAVKTLRAGNHDPVAATRLLREAWVTGALEHPNVCPVYDVAIERDGRPRVLLKRIDGVDWATLLADPRALSEIAEGDVEAWNVRTLMQVCNAIHFAHSRRILHRDIKPENVMIGRFGEVYVVDWGIAVSLANEDGSRLPLARDATEIAGTPAYIAPEMLLGEPAALGPATDVYLLGAVLFELVVGRPPHEGTDVVAIFASSLGSPPEIPSKVPRELAEILRKSMARDPTDRYETVEELRRALADYLEHRHSMRLAYGAQNKLNELIEEVRSGASDATLYPLYGECQFGFRAALDAWSENEAARGGLRVAGEAMLRREIDAGNLDAARRVLSDLGTAPADLATRFRELEALREGEAARRAALEAFERDQDPRRGSRTRVFVGLVLGGLWTLVPVFAHFWLRASGREPSSRFSLLVALGSFPVVVALGVWARESLTATALNRGIYGTLVFTIVAQIVLDGLLIWTGTPFMVGASLSCFLWAVCAGLGALHLDARLWPIGAAYALAAIAQVALPGYALLVMSSAQVVLMGTIVFVWGAVAWR